MVLSERLRGLRPSLCVQQSRPFYVDQAVGERTELRVEPSHLGAVLDDAHRVSIPLRRQRLA